MCNCGDTSDGSLRTMEWIEQSEGKGSSRARVWKEISTEDPSDGTGLRDCCSIKASSSADYFLAPNGEIPLPPTLSVPYLIYLLFNNFNINNQTVLLKSENAVFCLNMILTCIVNDVFM